MRTWIDDRLLDLATILLKLLILIVFIISTTLWVLWRLVVLAYNSVTISTLKYIAVALYQETKEWKVRKKD